MRLPQNMGASMHPTVALKRFFEVPLRATDVISHVETSTSLEISIFPLPKTLQDQLFGTTLCIHKRFSVYVPG